MGRIKDLRDKVKDGDATSDEEAELKELEEEAKAEDTEAADEEKQVAAMVDKIVKAIEIKQQKAEKTIEEKEMTKESGFAKEWEAKTDDQKIVSFFKALRDEDKAKLKVMSVGESADGGYLVPTVLYNKLIEEMVTLQQISSRATIIDPCPPTLNLDQLIGTAKSYWVAEKAIKDTTTLTFDQISLTPYAVACIVTITNQLEEDAEVAAPVSALVTRNMANSINTEMERVFAVGTGTTQPTGINAYAATVHRIVATPANVLTADSLIDVVSRLDPAYMQNAVWLMNSITWRKAMQLKDSQNRYLFIADPTGKTPGTILGYPVLRIDALPAANIWFGDLKGYYIGYRGGLSVSKSTEASITQGTDSINLFERNMFAIRVERRVDGELADLDSMVVLTGAN